MIWKNITMSIVPAAVLALSSSPATIAADSLVTTRTTTITACGDLFDIDSNAAGMTAEERAAKVQANLDNALIAALDRTPAAVRVQYKNNNPIVTLDNYMIVTADGNSASRSNMSQLQLAEKWAKSIRMCLANAGAMDKYLSLLTGKYPAKKIVSATTLRVTRCNLISFTARGGTIAFTGEVPLSFTANSFESRLLVCLHTAILSPDRPIKLALHTVPRFNAIAFDFFAEIFRNLP